MNQRKSEGILFATGLLTEAGLAFVATRLGFEWTLLAIQLGLQQEKVEQIQMSMRNAYQQILEALRVWRDLPITNNNNTLYTQEDGGGESGGVSDREVAKIRQLLQALRQDGIEKFKLVEEITDKFHLQVLS